MIKILIKSKCVAKVKLFSGKFESNTTKLGHF